MSDPIEQKAQPDGVVADPPDTVPAPYTGPERRVNNMHAQNTDRLDRLEQRTTTLETLMAANTQATLDGNADVKVLLELVGGAQKGIRIGISFTKTLSVIAKVVTPIIVAAGIIWAMMHGKMPGPD